MEKVFSEILRVLKDNGILILRDSNKDYPKWKQALLFLLITLTLGLKLAREHYKNRDKWYSLNQVKSLITKYGLKIVEVKDGFEFLLMAKKLKENKN